MKDEGRETKDGSRNKKTSEEIPTRRRRMEIHERSWVELGRETDEVWEELGQVGVYGHYGVRERVGTREGTRGLNVGWRCSARQTYKVSEECEY